LCFVIQGNETENFNLATESESAKKGNKGFDAGTMFFDMEQINIEGQLFIHTRVPKFLMITMHLQSHNVDKKINN